MAAQIMIVDDVTVQRRHLKTLVEQHGHQVTPFRRIDDCLAALKAEKDSADVIILNLAQDQAELADLLYSIQLSGRDIPVICVAAGGGMNEVVQALRQGIFGFVIAPVSPERFYAVLHDALQVHRLVSRYVGKKSRSSAVSFLSFDAASDAMNRTLLLARKASHNQLPVLIEGEFGVGKLRFASAIHHASDRATKPFVTVQCDTLDRGDLERELFGKGQDIGALQRASGGTILISEVSKLSSRSQERLLSIVEDNLAAIDQKGGSEGQVRIIATTSEDLVEAVRGSRFREDLYYRLSVFPISVASLRKRPEDIEPLAKRIVSQAASEFKKSPQLEISAGALELLSRYDWPGNVRQLENAIYRAVALSKSSLLSEQDFPQILAQLDHPNARPQVTSTPQLLISNDWSQPSISNNERFVDRDACPTRAGRSAQNLVTEEKPTIASMDASGNVRTIAEIEEELIRFALSFYRGQMSQVARKLGIGRSTLYRKLKDYGIDPDNPTRDVA